jgi:hypothetical protein
MRLVNRPLMVVISHIRGQTLNIPLDMSLDLPISEKCEAVLVSISNIVILESGIFDCLQEMNGLTFISMSHAPWE